MSNITIIKSKLNRGLELTQQESWELYKYIKALEQQPSDDCISREAVMKCFKKWQPYMATRLWDYEQELKDLPSVTPTISKMEQVEDCVARSEALDILDDFEEDVENGKFKTAYAKARERMCELPSVTPSYNSIKTDLKPCEDWKFYYKHGYTQAKRDLLCDDCISRQATIDAIYKKHIGGKDAIENAPINDLYACGLEEAVDAVENLPSVTPTISKMEQVENCISRKAVEEITWEEPSYTDALNVLTEIREKIRQLPSVTPQQKMGRWKNSKCDKCGASRPPLFDNYCPNCGAKMEVEE